MNIFGRLREARGPRIGLEAAMIKIRFAAETLPARYWDQSFDAGDVCGARNAYALVPVDFNVSGRGGYCAAVRDVDAEYTKFKRVTVAQAVCGLHAG